MADRRRAEAEAEVISLHAYCAVGRFGFCLDSTKSTPLIHCDASGNRLSESRPRHTVGRSMGATPGVAQKICRREERIGLDWPGSQYWLASGIFPPHRTHQLPQCATSITQPDTRSATAGSPKLNNSTTDERTNTDEVTEGRFTAECR